MGETMLIRTSRECSLISVITSLLHMALFAWSRILWSIPCSTAQGNLDKRVWVKKNTPELSKDMGGIRWKMKCWDFLLTEHAELSRKAQ